MVREENVLLCNVWVRLFVVKERGDIATAKSESKDESLKFTGSANDYSEHI